MINNTERFCRTYSLLGILLLICIFCSSNAFAAAGMLIIAKDGPDAYVFLVRDRDDEHFEIPSGKNEKAANLNDMTKILESNYETALRETVEETRGYIGRQQLIQVSDAKDPSKRISVGSFVLYRANLPMFDLKAVRDIRIPEGDQKQWDPMREIKDYAWVDVDNIIGAINGMAQDRTGRTIRIHHYLPSELKDAKRLKWF